MTRPPNMREKSPRVTPFGSPKRPPTNTISNSIANPRVKNPFDEDDGYDEAKNPFAEDDDETSDADKKNPFAEEEYDNNLNPFA